MSNPQPPPTVKEFLKRASKNAESVGIDSSMYPSHHIHNGLVMWKVCCNYEQCNTMFVYVPSRDKWYYQKMYGDFYDDTDLETIGDYPSKPMKGNHAEAYSNADILYSG